MESRIVSAEGSIGDSDGLAALSWWVGEGIRRRLEDEEFEARIDKLDIELSASLTQSHQSDR